MSNDFNSLFIPPHAAQAKPTFDPELGDFSDKAILELWDEIKKEAIDPRQTFLRQWQHHLLYFLNRQWISYFGNGGGWRDKRLAPGMPRPVTNLLKQATDTIRALFTSVQLGVLVRPNGADPKNVAAAATADDLAPVLHHEHHMDQVLMEFDFWLIVCANAFLYTFLDYDLKYGLISDPSMTCSACGVSSQSSAIAEASACPDCAQPGPFTPTLDESGSPVLNQRPRGKPVTIPLSPLELAFSNAYPRFDEVPRVVRLRWRTKTYYKNHPVLKDLVDTIRWERGSGDLSLQLFKSLAQHNDLGLAQQFNYGGGGSMGIDQEEGITEYEVHGKPCDAYPKGYVFRIVGEGSGSLVLHLEDTEAIPGPLPYTTADGTPLFTFAHAPYEQVGGRVLGAGIYDIASDKNDQLNQVDSMFLKALYTTSNPLWMVRKGSEPLKLSGASIPGVVIKFDDPFGDGRGEPKRLPGIDPSASYFSWREQIKADFADLTGTNDVMGGANPPDVNAFSALQLLDERSKGRFIPVLQARANAYTHWARIALELEREFGPDERTVAVRGPARSWTFQNFKRSNLEGSITIEPSSLQMKTSLGERAALDHAVQMKFINPGDPDQQYEALKLMDLTKMIPAMGIDVTSALLKQQAFEAWAASPVAKQQSFSQAQQAMQQYEAGVIQQQMAYHKQILDLPKVPEQIAGAPPIPATPVPPAPQPGPAPTVLQFTPLVWRPWYNAPIHLREFLKWTNGDAIRQLITDQPALVPILEQHMVAIQQALPPMVGAPPKTSITLTGPDLADPQVRQVFDRSNALPPGDPSMTPPKAGTVPNPHATIVQQTGRPNAGSNMAGSNRESTQGNEPTGFKETAQNHGPA